MSNSDIPMLRKRRAMELLLARARRDGRSNYSRAPAEMEALIKDYRYDGGILIKDHTGSDNSNFKK